MSDTGNSRRNDTDNDPCPTVRAHSDTKADKEGKENTNTSRWHIHQGRFLWVIAKVVY